KNNHATNHLSVRNSRNLATQNVLPGQQLKVEWLGAKGDGANTFRLEFRGSAPEQDIDFTYWRIKTERGSIATTWQPAPEDYIKIDGAGNIEISHTEPIHLQQFSLISRELKQEEV